MKSAFDLVANRAGGESTPAKLIGDIPGTSPKGASARSLMGHALQTAILGG
jgi:hypothetical protein